MRFFFFSSRRRHTRWTGDWSSDVCSSDLGAGRMMEFGDNFTMYGTGMGKPGLAVCKPYDGNSATVGNGNMTSIACDSRGRVDALHAKAMELRSEERRVGKEGRCRVWAGAE